MDKRAVINILAQFKERLEAQGIRPRKIILYGSHASGTMREGSDIDVVVISDDFTERGYWERIDILAQAIYQVFAPIEAVAMTLEEWVKGDSFFVDYAKNGEVLFAA